MWMIPSQFGDSLQEFARAFAKKDDDGVFRYEAEQVDERDREIAETDDPENWFDTSTDPELARALAEARAVANKHVDDPDPTAAPEPGAPAARREIASRPAQPAPELRPEFGGAGTTRYVADPASGQPQPE